MRAASTERQILYIPPIRGTKNRRTDRDRRRFPGIGRRVEWRVLLKGAGFQFGKMRTFWRWMALRGAVQCKYT